MSMAGLTATRELAEKYSAVVRSLTPSEWSSPSRCAGWSVKDLVAHTGSNFKVMIDPPEPDPATPPPETAEEMQELLVAARRDWTPIQVADEFLGSVDGALGVLEALQQGEVATAPITLTDLGTYQSHQLSDAFAFDLWCHMYVDLLSPEGPVSRGHTDHDEALVSAAVGWMWGGLPQMCPRVNLALGRPLGIRLSGVGGGEWTLHAGSELLSVQSGVAAADTVITSAAMDFVLWGTTRTSWRDHVRIDGDAAYAASVLDTVDIV